METEVKNNGVIPLRIVTTKTKIPLSSVLSFCTVAVAVGGFVTLAKFQLEDHAKRIELLQNRTIDMDKKLQHLEDNSLIMKELLREIKADVKEIKEK